MRVDDLERDGRAVFSRVVLQLWNRMQLGAITK